MFKYHSDMGHCFSYVVVVSKKGKKNIYVYIFFTFLYLGKMDMELGKKVAIFAWEWGGNLAPRDGQRIPCIRS